MQLENIKLNQQVYSTLINHSLTTEEEEVIGLLIGNFEMEDSGAYQAQIFDLVVVIRSDKKKDRVEIGAEQLHEALNYAEEIEAKTKRTTSVIGWYHSHPHITVYPSQVDLKTQLSQQLLDERFFGLILSCYDDSFPNPSSVQLIAFQTNSKSNNLNIYQEMRAKYISIDLVPNNATELNNEIELQMKVVKQLYNENKAHFNKNVSLLKSLSYKLERLSLMNHYNLNLERTLIYQVYPLLETSEQDVSNEDLDIDSFLNLESTEEANFSAPSCDGSIQEANLIEF